MIIIKTLTMSQTFSLNPRLNENEITLIKQSTNQTIKSTKQSKEQRRKQCVAIFKKKYKTDKTDKTDKTQPLLLKSINKDIIEPYITLHNLIISEYNRKYNDLNNDYIENNNIFYFQYNSDIDDTSEWTNISNYQVHNFIKDNFIKKEDNKWIFCALKKPLLIEINSNMYELTINEKNKLIQTNINSLKKREMRIKFYKNTQDYIKKHM